MRRPLRALRAPFDPRGRLSARAYRHFLIRALLAGIGLLSLGIWSAAHDLRWVGIGFAAGTLPVALAVAIQTLRRLHDRDRGGGWLAAYGLVEALGFLPLDRAADSHPLPVIALVLAMLAFSAWFLVETVLRPGTGRANRHGPPPAS